MNINVNTSEIGVNLDAMAGTAISNAIQISITNSLAIVKDEWQRRVQQKLNSTRPLYLMGLDFDSVVYPFGSDPFAGAVVLKGKFPNMLEAGFPAFDEKVGFSKSSRKHPTKDGGWYLTIPMRHSTPGSFMYGKPMPKNIYGQVKKLNHKEHISVPGGQKTSWTGYVHKNNIYDGLTRIIKSYHNPDTGKTTKQSQYFTFRRVSDKSDPLSWMHPGYSGVKIADALQPYALQTLERELRKNLAAALT